MLEIVYDRKNTCLTVSGHADCGERGHDLVCAAVSALTQTLAADIDALCAAEPEGYTRGDNSLAPGAARIACRPLHGGSVAALIFDSVCMGFRLLAKGYPRNISYKTE